MSTTQPSLPFDRPGPMQPPPLYAELRERTPVAAVTAPDGQRAWLVTSYDAVAAVLADPRLGMAPPGTAGADNDTLFQDGEPHLRLRRLVSKAFTPRSIAAQGPRIHRQAAEHVAALAAAGPPADLVTGLAAPLSIQVISDLLGVAIDEREHFHLLVEALGAAEFLTDGSEENIAAAIRAWQDLSGYAAGLVAAKRRALGDDLLSALIRVRDTDDGRLSDDELIGMATTLIAAGYQTARNGISAGTVQVVTEGRLAGLADVPERLDAVVEEVLRHLGGLIAEPFPRWAHTDLELHGVPIAAGDLVLVRLEAANRDPRHFADPDRFLPGRQSAVPHLTFGRGLHHCLGAALARIELAAAFRALAGQLPGLRLQIPPEQLDWVRGQSDAGPTAVPVTW
ncbi:cytochrome P450 [Streptomyces sp. MP131-18]|uniref:cytochrome P450 n=1 Tax=Streptomyces sp. MP131-18 TaxID=1857892 RepID=UPI00097C5552|nr:cytochrome P450 [Streptomyces sp. MP131-18]ONK11684.1 6-deoxyerythronolide B hydroxylase [Streptomyces sp. MP131-18]